MAKKTLVAYFSASGTTARVARLLAAAIDADLYEIKPAVPYTGKDLNWQTERPTWQTMRKSILDFPSGGTPRPESFHLFWKAMIGLGRPSFCLPLPAAAGWEKRRRSWRLPVPALSCRKAGC